MDELRTRRVEEMMREELSELIRFELSDPRVTEVDVSAVHVSHDLKRADVVVAAGNPSAIEGLEHARHFLRRQLMQRLDLFRMPELRFVTTLVGNDPAQLRKLQRRLRRGRGSESST
ncbi:MAG: 30S ribosome-binding factor RbfA [Bryobacterales bacterium]|nr:30S ribosome-binding factor RbfA [Bryobacterales bacterium]